VVATTSYKKLVVDMHYEARIQAIVSYHGSVLGKKVTKQQARILFYLLICTLRVYFVDDSTLVRRTSSVLGADGG
jgi:hypothetical protein